ncbi:MAG: CHAT domain-containing protein [Hydrococcus sp. Prado102]|jgi:CHAT domain-containing protein|nr:CHAT domain-containing protein [Hydrococcus sp. Prado102]
MRFKYGKSSYRRIAILILSALFGLILALNAPVWANDSSHALELAQKGQQRYDIGQYDEAAQLWQEAAQAYEKAGDRSGMTKSLINRAQALQDLGLYPRACNALLQAFAIENPDCTPEQVESLLKSLYPKQKTLSLTQAIGLRSLGDVLRRQGILEQSQAVLQLSWIMAEHTPEASATLLSLGNIERALGNQIRDRTDYEAITEIIDLQSPQAALDPYKPAFNAYNQAATVASSSPIPKLQAQLNSLKLLLDLQQWWTEQANRRIASWSRFNEIELVERGKNFLFAFETKLREEQLKMQSKIESNFATLAPSRAAIYARINFAQSLMQSKQTDKVEPILDIALQQARTLGDARAESYALGYLGELYDRTQQLDKATQLTQEALILSQQENSFGDAREISYLWQSQLGSLLKERGDTKGAIASYASAFNTLQSLRNDLNANNRDVQFDFLQEVKPVYLELADLLLKSDLSSEELNTLILANPDPAKKQSNLQNLNSRLELARRTIESLQLAELDNFFQDPCSQETDVAVQIDEIDPQAAVIYPIVFKDRIEVILSLPGKPLQEAAISISESEVNNTLDRLYDYLDNTTINNSARNILATANPDPQELKANLQQLLPIFTRIYDWLIRPFETDLQASQTQNLVFVLNGQLQRVPMAALYDGKQYAIEKYGIALVPSLQLMDLKQSQRQQLKVLAAGVSQQMQVKGEIFPALVNVPTELNAIAQAFPASERLLDREFTVTTFQSQLQSNFPIVHLATHGLFSSNPQKNFIITGDGNSIDIEKLSTLLRTEKTNDLELLVLSACETATGDERAVLGLAGMAIRSGARSTLATLWPVEDASTAGLMSQFYQELRTPQMKKLSALKIAQRSLLESLKSEPPFNELKDLPPHPYYWAPYVLVGNWQ